MNKLMSLENFKCKLIPLTPIHIGSGNEIEPYDYVIKKGIFYRINSMDIFEKLSEKEQEIFTSKIEEGIFEFRTYMRDIYKEEFGYIYKSSVDKNFESRYTQKLSGAKLRNDDAEFVVKEFMGGLKGKYIAGSSLKGSIRGAFIFNELPEKVEYKLERDTNKKTMPINLYDFGKPVTNKKAKNNMDKSFDKEAFKMKTLTPFTDPFKRLTITDSLEYNNVTKIADCIRISRDKTSNIPKRGSSETLEVLKSKYVDNEENILEFNMSIRFMEKNGGVNLLNNYYDGSDNKKRPLIENILTFDQGPLLDAVNNKSKAIIEEEKAFYTNRIMNVEIQNFYKKLEKELEQCEEELNSAIIRIGKGCGFATFTHFLKSNNCKDKSLHSASRVLAEGKYPMGWAKIVIEQN
ncbi:MAG: type III-A CRISPR-associated RAMP protein Csm5 [Fusobacteriaceae bacterium]|nr:type III-A CRISPR-associated RAMP protein Csm5 [Fusobacteriaceae bacterium]